MAENCSHILARLAEHYLSIFLYDTARFYAERCYYENPNPQSLNLLAQCFLREGKSKQAYLILLDSELPANRYLFALSCVSLHKYGEAEKALLPPNVMGPNDFSTELYSKVPGGGAGLYLLGVICRRESRIESAIEYFKMSLKVTVSSVYFICVAP